MYLEQRSPLLQELGLSPSAFPKLKSYLELLWAANEELNLISRKMKYEELIDNHVIDCLLPLKDFPLGLKSVADLGAGGGLPGVLYAIQFPEMTYHLYEKSPKKRDFLTRCLNVAPNLRIQGEIPSALPGIQLVTARAFKPLDVILDMTRDYYKNGGRYFLLKGRREKIEEELGLAQKKFKDLASVTAVTQLRPPTLDVERNLVGIRL